MITDNCIEEIQHSARLNITFGRRLHNMSQFYTVFLATFEIHISSQWRGSPPTVKYNQFLSFVFLLLFVLSKQCNYGNGNLKKINYKRY